MAGRVLSVAGLEALFSSLTQKGYTVIGPTRRDGAIVYDRIDTPAELPTGWTDLQQPGKYRLERRSDEASFGYNLGPTSWKRFLFPPVVEVLRIKRQDGSLAFSQSEQPREKLAFIGVRACELAAIAIQDQVFLDSGSVDTSYASRRSGLFIVAVNCGTAGETCFCVSMGTGPRCTDGYDLVMTEVMEGATIEYVTESATPAGDAILGALAGREISGADEQRVAVAIATAVDEMGRIMDTDGLRDLLVDNPTHPRWDEVAARCLTCGNCTLACPTCFCSTTVDTVTLDGDALRSRRWDSCFSLEHSLLHKHPVRSSARSRYRQWMTHKLATWEDQFGTSGCVGCGRCITWCPVGIDITEEVSAMRATVTG